MHRRRSSRGRLALALALGGCLPVAGTGLAAVAAARAVEGVRVQVDSAGPASDRIDVSVPGVVAELAFSVVPDSMLEEAAREIGPHRDTLAALAEALDTLPDAVYFEVVSRHESVRVAKRGGALAIEVDTLDDDVRVVVPVRLARRVLNRLARLA